MTNDDVKQLASCPNSDHRKKDSGIRHIKINSQERNALRGMSLEAQLIYILEIRAKMDYITGISGGEKDRTSYQAWREVISVVPDLRSKYKQNTNASLAFLRAKKDELLRRGIITQVVKEKNDYMVFHLPLACVDSVCPISQQQHSSIAQRHSQKHSQRHEKIKQPVDLTKDLNFEQHAQQHAQQHPLDDHISNVHSDIPPVLPVLNYSLSENENLSTQNMSSSEISRGTKEFKAAWSTMQEIWLNATRPIGNYTTKFEEPFETAIQRDGVAIVLKGARLHVDAWNDAKKAKLKPYHMLGLLNFLKERTYLEAPNYVGNTVSNASNKRAKKAWDNVLQLVKMGKISEDLALLDNAAQHTVKAIGSYELRMHTQREQPKLRKKFFDIYEDYEAKNAHELT